MVDPVPAGEDVRTPALLRALTASPVEVATLIMELHGRVHDENSLLDLMARASREAVRMIADATWAGVTSVLGGTPFTAAHTDERVLVVDEGQYGQGDGPCLTASRTGHTVTMTLAEVRARWPGLADVAAGAGVRSFHAEPLRVRADPLGSLNIYSTRDEGIRISDPDVLTVLVEYLERGLAAYLSLDPRFDHYLRLRQALARRRLTAAATGVLMAVHQVTREQAESILSIEAGRRSMPIETVAAEIVDTHTER